MVPRCEGVLYMPLTVGLPKGRVAQQPSRDQHLMCWYEDALQVRRIPLRERQLRGEPLKRNTPRSAVLVPNAPNHTQQPV